MRVDLSTLWRLNGLASRRTFAVTGFSLVALKVGLDYLVSTFGFGKRWTPLLYFQPEIGSAFRAGSEHERNYYLVMAAISAPFLWVAFALSIRRLRSAELPAWLSAVVLLPILKLVLFGLLCLAPDRPAAEAAAIQQQGAHPTRFQKRSGPDNALMAAILSVLAADAVAALLAWLCVGYFREYSAVLFLGMPTACGLLAVVLWGIPARRERGECICLAITAVVVGLMALLTFAFEGVVCLTMALPLVLPLAVLGGILGYGIQSARWAKKATLPIVLGMLCTLPVLMGAEAAHQAPRPVYRVVTSVVVNAAPEVVWRHVIAFPQLPPPSEPLFNAGIAYPIRAEIRGHGPGAVRYCEFSTGPFVEPITTWDEPRLLQFNVTSNPEPMQELSPYGAIDTPHLHGFMRSHKGQFRLEPLPGGRTLLEGTTWYEHGLGPAAYWKLWTDVIVHQIHQRVLVHIKTLAEHDPAAQRVIGA